MVKPLSKKKIAKPWLAIIKNRDQPWQDHGKKTWSIHGPGAGESLITDFFLKIGFYLCLSLVFSTFLAALVLIIAAFPL